LCQHEKNLHLKSTIYENDAENETPCSQADDVTACILVNVKYA